MSAYWDFRSILDVYPDGSDFTCVGITQKGARCRQRMFSGSDRSCASRILDEMDSHKKLSSSRIYLEDLAGLTLCPRWHRKPGYSQVQSVTTRWKRDIAEYAAEVEEEQERATKVKSRVLAEKKKTEVNIKVKLDKDVDKASFANSVAADVKRESVVSAKLEITKPIVSATHMPKISLTNIVPPPTLDNILSRFEATLKPDLKEVFNLTSQTCPPPLSFDENISQIEANLQAIKLSLKEKSSLTSQKCSLSSPPASPVESNTESNTATSNGIKLEQCPPETPTKSLQNASLRQTFTIAKTSSIKATATAVSNEVAPKAISHKMTKIETFNFDFPPTPDATPEPRTKQEATSNLVYEFGAGKQVPIPTFDLGVAATLSTPLPATDLSTVSHGDNASFQSNDAPKLNSKTGYKIPSTSFDFSTSIKLPSFEADPFVSNSDGTPKSPAIVPTNPGLVTPEATPEPVRQNSHDQEESYGYAIVTPSCTRYKSYLPSQQRYGLQTPPDTPETINDGFKDPFLAFISDSSSSVTEVLRKPLRAPPTLLDGVPGKCEACGVEEGQYGCDEDLGNERVGCFHSLRLRKLRKSVLRKMNAVKTRVSGAMHRKSNLPQTG